MGSGVALSLLPPGIEETLAVSEGHLSGLKSDETTTSRMSDILIMLIGALERTSLTPD